MHVRGAGLAPGLGGGVRQLVPPEKQRITNISYEHIIIKHIKHIDN